MSAVVVDFDVLKDVRELDARAARDLADWLAFLELEGKADRTVYDYALVASSLARAFPDKELRDFTDGDLSHFLRALPERSRWHRWTVLNQLFKWGRFTRRIGENPMDFVAKPRRPRRGVQNVFSDAERALLEALPSPDGPLFAILFGTGLRKGEACRLRFEHIDLDRRRLIVYQGKGDKDRIVTMLEPAARAVADLALTERLERPDHLWYAKWGGKRIMRREAISPATFHAWYKRCLDAAGVRYLNPHRTRHTYATYCREELRVELDDLQELLGHASISTTSDLYSHTRAEDVARRLIALEAAALER